MKSFLKLLFVVAIVMCSARALAADAKPNVIFILADDLGYGDVGCYGQEKIKTPNLDRLAAQGMRFTQHYAGSTVCAPSRSCLLTGLHTGHAYVRGNPGSAVKQAPGDTGMRADSITFAKLFKNAGYTTAIIGKWGMGHPGTSGEPAKQGFDYFYGYAGHRDAHEYYPPHLWRNGEKIALDGKQYAHDLITDEALKFIGTAAGSEPFMLFYTPTIPHSKLQVPDLSPYESESWPENEKKFAAMITRLDASVGKLLDALAELKLDQNTLVVFTSDNGPHKEGGHSPEFFNSNGPLRGIKRDMYEGGIRVPMIARWPGKIATGSTSDHVSAFWDFLPTTSDLLGLPAPANTDGISYLPTLLARGEQKQHEALYWEFQEQGGKQAVRFGNYKAVRLEVSQKGKTPLESYDLSNDLAESKNIAAQHPEVIKRAEELLEKHHEPSKIFPLFPEEIKANPKPRARNRAS